MTPLSIVLLQELAMVMDNFSGIKETNIELDSVAMMQLQKDLQEYHRNPLLGLGSLYPFKEITVNIDGIKFIFTEKGGKYIISDEEEKGFFYGAIDEMFIFKKEKAHQFSSKDEAEATKVFLAEYFKDSGSKFKIITI